MAPEVLRGDPARIPRQEVLGCIELQRRSH